MSDSYLVDISSHGIVAGHPQQADRPRFVAPSTNLEFNTVAPRLTTVGCGLVPDNLFEFDSSLILPGADKSFQRLVKLIKSKPDCPLSVFGHADPVGRDRYNKRLSGRRALAVYAVLIRDTEIWEKKLYKKPKGGDKWGIRSTQIILQALGYSPGEITGLMNQETEKAVEDFQRDFNNSKTDHRGHHKEFKELEEDGDPGENTRGRLYELYMDYLCKDSLGNVFYLQKTDFLARGEHEEGKGDCQGCGEFNPVMVFSEQQWDEYKKEENHDARNEANAPNRRVIVFLFAKGTVISATNWPCPTINEGGTKCKDHFWSDGEARRSDRLEDEQRKFQETEDTFGCRFYHGLASYSPCEAGLKLWVIRLLVDGANRKKIPLSSRRFVITAGSTTNAPLLRGTTDERGFLRIPALHEFITMTLKLDVSGYLINQEQQQQTQQASQAGQSQTQTSGSQSSIEAPPENGWEDEDKFFQFTLKCGDLLPMLQQDYDPAKQRLYNLGYGAGNPLNWDQRTENFAIKSFQKDHDFEQNSVITAETRAEIKKEYGC